MDPITEAHTAGHAAGYDLARAEVRRIAEACTEHPDATLDEDCPINGADLVGGNDRTDGLMAWLGTFDLECTGCHRIGTVDDGCYLGEECPDESCYGIMGIGAFTS